MSLPSFATLFLGSHVREVLGGLRMLQPWQGPMVSGQNSHRSGQVIMVITVTISVLVQRWGGVKESH